MKRIWDEIGPPVFGIVALIVVWAIVAALTDTRGVPSPAEVWSAFLTGMRDGTIPEATVKTLLRLLFAFACSIAIGVAIGVGMALNEFTRRSVRPLLVALQITPFVAWLPLAVIWFGASERAVVFVTIVGAFPSVTLATMSAIRQVPPILTRAEEQTNVPELLAVLGVIVVIGVAVDYLLFHRLDRRIRKRRGLLVEG